MNRPNSKVSSVPNSKVSSVPLIGWCFPYLQSCFFCNNAGFVHHKWIERLLFAKTLLGGGGGGGEHEIQGWNSKTKHELTKTQLLSWVRGWSVGKGSGVMTSRPAAKILPSFNAVNRSSWKIENQITLSTWFSLMFYFLNMHCNFSLSPCMYTTSPD